VQFTLFNKDTTNALAPIAGPLAMFSRIRVFISGIHVENWDFVSESTVLMDRLKGAARRQNDSIEHHLLTSGTGDTYQAIAASGARKVMLELPCGATKN
jgi:hypothetical protein